MDCFLVLIKDSKRAIPAYYLNEYPLEDECGGENNKTGWFYDESNFEWDDCYYPIEGDVIAYAPMPSAEAVHAALVSI